MWAWTYVWTGESFYHINLRLFECSKAWVQLIARTSFLVFRRVFERHGRLWCGPQEQWVIELRCIFLLLLFIIIIFPPTTGRPLSHRVDPHLTDGYRAPLLLYPYSSYINLKTVSSRDPHASKGPLISSTRTSASRARIYASSNKR